MLPLLLAAADVADQTVTQWIINGAAGLLLLGLVGLLRHAVTGLTNSVEANTKALEATKAELATKMDALRDQVARGDGDRRVLEAELRALQKRVDQLEERMREVSEGLVR